MFEKIAYEEGIARIQLFRTDRVGPITYWNLIKIYGTAVSAIRNLSKMAAAGGCREYKVYDRSLVELEIEKLDKIGGRVVFTDDNDYPKFLTLIDDRPPFLSMIGKIDNTAQVVSIVGARNASLNAQKFCYRISSELSSKGIIVCSGMARGIDTKAHEGALNGGTVAVLAGGIDVVYPPENQKLYDEIKEKGAIISESAFGTQPQSQLFPKRNRIIAGMSSAIVVAEAALKSGSLITARAALEYGRDVFAIPGFPEDPRCKGSNLLIKNGANLLESADDIIESIRPFEVYENRNEQSLYQLELMSEDELDVIRKKLAQLLSYDPVLIDDLVKSCNNNAQGVLIALIELELAGKIVRLNGQRVSLSVED